MAFRKKALAILQNQPDILIVQECECAEKLIFPSDVPKPSDTLWFGNNQHKGIAIFSYGDYRLKLLEVYNADLQHIIPVAVSDGVTAFILFAIWANHPTDPDGQYVEQVWKAINYYDDLLQNTQTILTGDFNSNTIWDRKRRIGNHSDVVKYLADKGIFSAYHLHYQQIQGKEQHPTFYLYKHQDKPYHMDYCFVSADIASRLTSVLIGEYDFWKQFSDHLPVMVSF